jgi:hypothetical protein
MSNLVGRAGGGGVEKGGGKTVPGAVLLVAVGRSVPLAVRMANNLRRWVQCCSLDLLKTLSSSLRWGSDGRL